MNSIFSFHCFLFKFTWPYLAVSYSRFYFWKHCIQSYFLFCRSEFSCVKSGGYKSIVHWFSFLSLIVASLLMCLVGFDLEEAWFTQGLWLSALPWPAARGYPAHRADGDICPWGRSVLSSLPRQSVSFSSLLFLGGIWGVGVGWALTYCLYFLASPRVC